VPAGLSMVEAAAIPEAFATSYLNLCIEGGMKSGETVFIQAGASGLGMAAIQLAKILGAKVVTTVGSEEKEQFVRDLGADVVIDPTDEDLPARVRELAPDGIDYIVDATGNPDALAEAIPLVKRFGTFMIFGVCPRDASISVNPHDLYQAEAKIIASKMPPLTLGRASQLIEAGLIDYERIVTTALALDALPEAIRMFDDARDEHVKMMIDPWR